ncbi:MAG TPA: ATP-binding protein [Candidatus Limnocylindrales bacterium]|nr:ATP-binding protein [Candidatus Limnocylindrales bacterium]
MHSLESSLSADFLDPGGNGLDRRSETLAHLLETALSEQFATPVVELLGAMPVPLAVVHAPDLLLVAANEPLYRILRRAPAEAVGLRLPELVPPPHALADPGPYHGVAADHRSYDRLITVDGETWRWFIRPLLGRHHEVEYLLTGLIGGNHAPDATTDRLREANAAKTEFLNMAAHELRTPLGVIHGYGSLLAQGGLKAEHQQLAGARIYEKARQLSRLIADMMLVARFDELGPDLSREPLDLLALVDSLVLDLRRRSPDLAIELVADVSHAPIVGNPDWLGLAVRELLDNAARFRPKPMGRIDVSLTCSGAVYTVTIVDDGFGIAEQDQARLFRRFSAIETEENRHLVGLGIGLYLVVEIARAHKGEVGVVSRAGQGSEFRLAIPQAQDPAADPSEYR